MIRDKISQSINIVMSSPNIDLEKKKNYLVTI